MAVEAQFALCGSQDWMDNVCGGGLNLFYNPHLQQQQQQKLNHHHHHHHLQQQQQFNNMNIGCVLESPPLKTPSMASYSQIMDAYDEKHRQEIDYYIRLQNERLRFLLQEQRKQHLVSLMKIIESKAGPLLRQKDEEILEGYKRRRELEDFLKRIELENQEWQRISQEKESMVISLSNTIDELREKKGSCCFDNGAEDAESCCNNDINRGSIQENRVIIIDDDDDDREGRLKKCRGCNDRNSCILFLPCRHLCSCKDCEAFLDCCPVCQTVKKASIEALIV
ncbi:probable BOI-related E3 ubiquitin-protein ligase 2 [Mercurialis annua]|uniref:probable BOI-related E3 ubiquitin-protein ligase 2 n=1 Tax=Mercurialis annua TaxID=3986 RepID=UPI00215F896C|nr:probable BOI-related E3 ubiquitin-protein ligase 2 [Mercurialis annua]